MPAVNKAGKDNELIEMIIVAILALIAAVGLRNLAALFAALYRWATVRDTAPAHSAPAEADEFETQQAGYLAALRAKESAAESKRSEKERIRAERDAAKQAAAEWKAVEKERIRAAREAARQPAAQTQTPSYPVPAQTAQPLARRSPDDAGPNATGPEASEDKGPYVLPSVSLLKPVEASTADHSDVGEMSQRLIDTLKLFNIDAKIGYTVEGPVVTKYAILLARGIRYSSVTNIAANLKGALHAKSLRIEAPVPGEEAVGIEVPNRRPAGISFREIFESAAWRGARAELPLLFGKRADGKELVADLASMPHMLVAGATGQGKSVCLNSLICGLLMTRTPEQLKLIMVDPKCVEFTPYASIPHLLVPVITDNRNVVYSHRRAVAGMEQRLQHF